MNVILLVSDTFRYDNLSGRALMAVRTPELDRFARRAVSLSEMFIGSFPTIPYRTELTAGRYGWPWYPWQSRLASTRNHMPELFRRAGYVSQLICDCPHLFPADFDRGFDGAVAVRGQEGDTYFLRMNHPIPGVMPPEKTRSSRHFQQRNLVDLASWTNRYWRIEEDRFPPRTARLAIEWLEENYKHRPFLLWVDFFDPHEPWDPPEYMVKRYDPQYEGTPMLHPNYGKADDYSPEELRNLRAHYCAEAELVDRWVGRVLQKIDDLGLWENSLVAFTSDHGISLGEHNRTGKSNINTRDDRFWPLYSEICRVPFLIAAPGLEGGQTIEGLTQPPDILPTLLDLAGLKVDPPEAFHGRSFAPLLRGESREALRDCAVCGCYLRLAEGGGLPKKSLTPALYTHQWAYVPFGPDGRPELFDLQADPYCETNILELHKDVAGQLRRRLLEWLRGIGAPPEAIAVYA